jgi:hypothetical protein
MTTFLSPADASRIAREGRRLHQAGELSHAAYAVLDTLLWTARKPGDEMPQKKGKGLNGQPAFALSILHDLIAGEGRPLPGTAGFPSDSTIRGVWENRWRTECKARRLAASDEPKQQSNAYQRAFTKLQNHKLIAARDGLVWLAHQQSSSHQGSS